MEALLMAARALAVLVREEYPQGYTLAEIARTWNPGSLTQDHLDALKAVEDLIDTQH